MSQVFVSAQDSIINNLVYGCLLFVFQLRQKTWTATSVTEIVRGSSWGENHTYFCSFNKTHCKSRMHLEETIKPYKLYPYSTLTQWNFLYHIATRVTSFLFKTPHAASKEDRDEVWFMTYLWSMIENYWYFCFLRVFFVSDIWILVTYFNNIIRANQGKRAEKNLEKCQNY